MDKCFPPPELLQASGAASAQEAELCLQQYIEAVCCNGSGGKQRSPKESFGNHSAAAHSLCSLAAPTSSSCQPRRAEVPTANQCREILPQWIGVRRPISRAASWAVCQQRCSPTFSLPHTSSIPLPPAPGWEQDSANPLGRTEGKASKSSLTGTWCR